MESKRLLQNALVSVVVALRDDPERYLLIDRMELTPFTTNTIISYDSFLAIRRQPYQQGNEQFVSARVLDMAERILHNLQKCIVDNTISIAAGQSQLKKVRIYTQNYPQMKIEFIKNKDDLINFLRKLI